MHIRQLGILAALAALLFSAACSGGGQTSLLPPAPDPLTAQAAIPGVVESFFAALNSHDNAGASALTASRITFGNAFYLDSWVAPDLGSGRGVFGEKLDRSYEYFQPLEFSYRIDSIEVDGFAARAVGAFELHGSYEDFGSPQPIDRSGKYLLLVYEEGQWLVTVVSTDFW